MRTQMADGPVGVVGGGLGGLAAACTLAARGRKVVLFERNDWLGGKAAELCESGFRFDMGPTILTLPSVLRRILAEAGLSLEDELPMTRLDPQWRCFFERGDVLDLAEGVEATAKNLEIFAPGKRLGEGYRKFMQASKRMHEASELYFFWRSVGGMGDMIFSPGGFRARFLGDLLSLRMGRTVGGTVRSFVPDARAAQMIDHLTQYVGSAPDNSPAVLCGIAHMQSDEGIWYPQGGTRGVAEALVRVARRLGVEVRCEAGVKRIVLAESGSGRPAVAGVELDDGEVVSLSAVVSNCDAVRTHRELIGGKVGEKFSAQRKYEPACSGVVLYLGLKERYPQLAHHNFVFSRDAHEEFDAIYRQGKPAPDPTCYVCAPSTTDPSTAPPGGEALYVLVHAPYLRPGQDWSKLFPSYRETILNKLETCAGLSDLRKRIVYESHLTPEDIHRRYHVLDGAIYGLASHGRFLGAFKPANRSRLVRGLYLAGGAAHPGPGMPMVMMSGWIAADSLDHDFAPAARTPAPAIH